MSVVGKIVRTAQLDAAVLYGTRTHFFWRTFPPFLCFRLHCFVVIMGVAISLDFDAFSILTRVLNPFFYFLSTLERLGYLHRAGQYQPDGFPFSSRGIDAWKDIRTSDGSLSSPGCAGSMYEPQPISYRPAP